MKKKFDEMIEYHEEVINGYMGVMKQRELSDYEKEDYNKACYFLIELFIWGLYSYERLVSYIM